MSLTLVPIDLRTANMVVRTLHRHHQPVRGCKFLVGVVRGEGEFPRVYIGAAIVGRPVGRGADNGFTAEVTRCVTNGTKNACSMLYGAAARAAEALGYRLIQTYILASEPGTPLKAAGWQRDPKPVRGRQWVRDLDDPTARQLLIGGTTRRTDQPTTDKVRWFKILTAKRKAS